MPRWALGVAGIAVGALGAWQGDDLATVVAGIDDRVTAIKTRLSARTGPNQVAEGPTFAGTGFAVSEPFDLHRGSAVVAIDAPTKLTNVKVVAAPGSGQTYNTEIFPGNWPRTGTTAITVKGNWPRTGTTAITVNDPGRYVLAVEAVGAWSVVVER